MFLNEASAKSIMGDNFNLIYVSKSIKQLVFSVISVIFAIGYLG